MVSHVPHESKSSVVLLKFQLKQKEQIWSWLLLPWNLGGNYNGITKKKKQTWKTHVKTGVMLPTAKKWLPEARREAWKKSALSAFLGSMADALIFLFLASKLWGNTCLLFLAIQVLIFCYLHPRKLVDYLSIKSAKSFI